jgi:hypothetical protein
MPETVGNTWDEAAPFQSLPRASSRVSAGVESGPSETPTLASGWRVPQRLVFGVRPTSVSAEKTPNGGISPPFRGLYGNTAARQRRGH